MADEEKKLLMDLESRLARAKEMGFHTDLPVYHGTDKTFQEFTYDPYALKTLGPGVYTTPDPKFASDYANWAAPEAGSARQVYPLFLKGKIFDVSNPEHTKLLRKSYDDYDTIRDAIPEIKKLGFDHVRLSGDSGNEIVTFDPKNIRSKFAAFDPAKSESADLSAFTGKKPKFPSIGKALGVAGTISDISDIAHGDIAEGALGLGSLVAGRASPYLGALRPEKTVSEELESRQLQEAKERQESEEEAKYKREALKRLMSSQED